MTQADASRIQSSQVHPHHHHNRVQLADHTTGSRRQGYGIRRFCRQGPGRSCCQCQQRCSAGRPGPSFFWQKVIRSNHCRKHICKTGGRLILTDIVCARSHRPMAGVVEGAKSFGIADVMYCVVLDQSTRLGDSTTILSIYSPLGIYTYAVGISQFLHRSVRMAVCLFCEKSKNPCST